jgi:hypothetical protein
MRNVGRPRIWTPGTRLAAGNPLANAILAYFGANEGGGTDLTDLLRVNPASYAAGVWTESPFGPAIDLDGATRFAAVTNGKPVTSNLETTQGMSFSAWLYWRTSTENYNSVFAHESFGLGLTLLFRSTQAVAFYNAGSGVDPVPGTSIPFNQWIHIAVTYDSVGNVAVYMNGVLAGSGTIGTPNFANPAADLWLGRSTFGSGRWFDGSMRDVGFWQRPLTASEVALLYAHSSVYFKSIRVVSAEPVAAARKALSARLGLAQLGFAGGLGIEQNIHGFTPPQVISLTGVATASAVGAIELRPVQAIVLAGVASVAAVGSISLSLSQGVQLSAVVGAQAVGVLTLRGGTLGLKVFIGGIERTNYVAWRDAATGQSSTSVGPGIGSGGSGQGLTLSSNTRGRWTATFTMYVPTGPGTWGPARGQTVLITDFGRRLFAGCITDVSINREMMTVSDIFFNCTATDKTSICDHRIVTTKTYAAGLDVADIFRDIFANFMIGEGIDVSSLPVSIGATASDLVYNYVTVTQALDQASQQAGASWWIDSFSAVQLALLVASPACPFSISETSNNWRNLMVSYSLLDYRNVQYVRSNLSTIPAQGGTTFCWTVNQPEAAARGFVQGAGILPGPAASVVSLKVNGVQKPFFYGSDPETFDVTNPLYGHVWWMFQNTPYVNPPGSATSVPNPPEKPSIGDVVCIVYIPVAAQSTQQVVASAGVLAPGPLPGNTPQNGESFGTCGSGIYENVQQVNDITSNDDLQAIATAMLARFGGGATGPAPQISFQTEAPGAAVGQALTVNIPRTYLASQQLLITDVMGVCLDSNLIATRPQLAFDALGSSFTWQITAGPDVGDWVKWFETIISRTQHPNPVIRREMPTFIIAPGGSVSSGTQSTNPYVVLNTGKLASAYAIAATPPVDQDLEIQIVSAAIGNLLKTPLVIPANSFALVQTIVFQLDPTYIFVNDVLTVVATYVNVGAAPIPAGSVTVGTVIDY